jgi:polyisoprenoid-binding protein YceI
LAWRHVFVGLASGLIFFGTAQAAPQPLTPVNTTIDFRAYALGLFPVDGVFQHFTGSITRDGDGCHVTLSVEVASMAMDDPDRRAQALSPALLDAAAFPQLSYTGDCHGGSVEGALTMHGVTAPFTVKTSDTNRAFQGEGTLARARWGMTGNSIPVGSTIRIRFSIRSPG